MKKKPTLFLWWMIIVNIVFYVACEGFSWLLLLYPNQCLSTINRIFFVSVVWQLLNVWVCFILNKNGFVFSVFFCFSYIQISFRHIWFYQLLNTRSIHSQFSVMRCLKHKKREKKKKKKGFFLWIIKSKSRNKFATCNNYLNLMNVWHYRYYLDLINNSETSKKY